VQSKRSGQHQNTAEQSDNGRFRPGALLKLSKLGGVMWDLSLMDSF
jgi:hypothetical protein